MADSTVLLTALGIVATCVAGLIWVIKYMFTHIMPMLEKINGSIDRNTKATKAGDDYLRSRDKGESNMWQEVRDSLHKIAKEMSGGNV